jgi:RNA polymerase sigma factor (sigma-70 family)
MLNSTSSRKPTTTTIPRRSVKRPLRVRPALTRFDESLGRRLRPQNANVLLESVRGIVRTNLAEADIDSVGTFEDIVNQCLDLGYRGESLVAFVYEVLRDRFAARVYRRLSSSGRRPSSAEVEDLVGVTTEAVQALISNANRQRHSLTYALLLSIADHRSIDYLRRKKADLVDDLDTYHTRHVWSPTAAHDARPDNQIHRRQRIQLARELRTAVLESVNLLPYMERTALILVEVEGQSYDEIALRLGIKRTDVGNVVRRARLKRDRLLMPLLRGIEQLEGHIGFKQIQAQRSLRLNLLRWTTEMGDGVCAACSDRQSLLHTADAACYDHALEHAEETPETEDVSVRQAIN